MHDGPDFLSNIFFLLVSARTLQEHFDLRAAGEWGSGERQSCFPLLLRGILLYIRHCELLRSPTAPVCFRNTASKQQFALSQGNNTPRAQDSEIFLWTLVKIENEHYFMTGETGLQTFPL
ncbi:hypothetical protein NQZ68_020282 [Dissostichus eleginoides]|nr:hypothetical protein NQZ68_020282 [Dissostichus eleginoides]